MYDGFHLSPVGAASMTRICIRNFITDGNEDRNENGEPVIDPPFSCFPLYSF